DRRRIAMEFAKKHRVILILKGYQTIVADYEGSVYVNDTGNPGMASGGCGDVLAGMIAALLGQKLSLQHAAKLGVYLHGLAGDIAATELGHIGLIASDIAARIPLAIQRYQTLSEP
ncbi:MAG: NAD(P)H-hydrate dehydratase, partial [Nitrososphaera sp.]|nr:NAD(P)H-hydrate dehydratase [Nitrososphaera sp.]